MTKNPPPSEFLVISRGQWDPKIPPETIQNAIDDFYAWIARHVDEGTMRPGNRLAPEGKLVSRNAMITDGPFAESKEVIGGFWFIRARSLDEAAQLAAQNPCLQCGLSYEIRPIDPAVASAFNVTTETPAEQRVTQ